MVNYNYEAFDVAGKKEKGVIAADTLSLARRKMRSMGLVPVKLEKDGLKKWSSLGSLFTGKRKIPAKELTILIRQFATMINASIPIEEALEAIALQSKNPNGREIIMEVREKLMEGQRLAQALSFFPDTFDQLFCSLISVGEKVGALGPILERLAVYMEKSARIKSKIKAALVYPIVLSITALGVVTLLMIFVVPQVAEQFQSMGQDLPQLTQVVIFISESFKSHGFIILGIFFVGAILFKFLIANPKVKLKIDGMLLKLPFLGNLLKMTEGARLARTLATMVGGGAPLMEALENARHSSQNLQVKNKLGKVVDRVKEGGALSPALAAASICPPILLQLISTGEKSSSLGLMLDHAANHLEEEFDDFITTALSLLEPLIIIFMGVMVGLIVFSILLPILQLNQFALG